MRNYENPTKCPRCGEPVSFKKQIGMSNDSPKCPSCGHQIHCSFCGHPQIEIKNDKWACPFIDGSPMHFGAHSCCKKENDDWLQNNRFEKAGFTLDEYRISVKEWNKPHLISKKREELRVLQR